ncbi:unnamed protein product [Trichobilharzia szidati]|nr:unnamed protein product [Trichobilharzia szidati]
MDQKSTEPIPVRKVTVKDISQIPPNHGTTPGGTLFSTTPGGTRIVYERDFILNCRNSPVARSPMRDLILLPEIDPSSVNNGKETHLPSNHETKNSPPAKSKETAHNKGDDSPFEMDV